ncbi:MAG: hypothetical protein AAF982_07335 [Pseudomonadota bacterium]
MLNDIKTVLVHSSDTLLQDAFGVLALTVMLMVFLHLPIFA